MYLLERVGFELVGEIQVEQLGVMGRIQCVSLDKSGALADCKNGSQYQDI